MSAANIQILELLRRYPRYPQMLEEVRRLWQVNALIHGDIKWDNCLYTANADRAAGAVMIVDWELADFGDGCWDAAAVLAAYVGQWALSLPADGRTAPLDLVRRAPFPLSSIWPAARAFWRAYTAGLGFEQPAAALDRTICYAAVRTIQLAYEYMQAQTQVHAGALCLLQLSMNVLAAPKAAASALWGL